ncbi:ThiF family adenylyltransferase [uncultured Mobiluncus sp.]|uniref:ThiF family adenylyltransferase n=1 Tax=uncultured Mobiluncus sp. TaxID=293425 RepID=UPI002602A7E4|nr:ThiF family adenylyltransferase [uncultured Mobiluncus sp.]
MATILQADLTDEPLDPARFEAGFTAPAAGCQLVFIGRVRNHDQGRRVEAITYSAHPDAARELQQIAGEAGTVPGVQEIALRHRVGHLSVGEVAILVGVSAAHRQAAFSTVSWLVDAIKDRVPIWKKQVFFEGDAAWSNLDADFQPESRYAAHSVIPGFGASGQERVSSAKVLVVGAGGLGSPIIAYLAAAGVGLSPAGGVLGIADGDTVSLSNLGRQVIHPFNRQGEPKTASAAATVRALNPEVNVSEEPPLNPQNAAAIIAQYDLVVDATDTFASKYLISDTCAKLARPLVWGSAVGANFEVSVFSPEVGTCLRTLYPTPPPPASTPDSASAGILGPVCGQAGSLMATEVLKVVSGWGEPLIGRLVIGNARMGKWNVVDYSARAAAPQKQSCYENLPGKTGELKGEKS